MDSITQVVLGAAVAEVVAGKKYGNKAILWGGIAGTIPDLDVLLNPFITELQSVAVHRGISHSFVFAMGGSLLFGWLTHRYYSSDKYKLWSTVFFSLMAAIIIGLLNFDLFSSGPNILRASLSVLVAIGSFAFLRHRYGQDLKLDFISEQGTWIQLFFWSLVTHPILDSFTTYGTQLFLPFSDYRVSFNNISVADPIYTVPFLICLIWMSFYSRSSRKRRIINYAGLAISSLYMLFTIFNKLQVNQVFEDTLQRANLSTERYMTSPTILNNALWYGCSITQDSAYFGTYSIFDDKKEFQIQALSRNMDLLEADADDETLKILRWFSNEYYGIIKRRDGRLQFNDLRYGSVSAAGIPDEKDYIFHFIIEPNALGNYELTETAAGPPDEDRTALLPILWKRIKGI